MDFLKKMLPGLGICLLIAIPAWFLGRLFPIIGGPVFGILFGMLIALIKRPACFEKGIQFTSKKILQYSIILLGFEMNLYHIIKVGGQSLFVMLFTLTTSFLVAFFVGRALHIKGKTTVLIGVGTSICGGSAIAATASSMTDSGSSRGFCFLPPYIASAFSRLLSGSQYAAEPSRSTRPTRRESSPAARRC